MCVDDVEGNVRLALTGGRVRVRGVPAEQAAGVHPRRGRGLPARLLRRGRACQLLPVTSSIRISHP